MNSDQLLEIIEPQDPVDRAALADALEEEDKLELAMWWRVFDTDRKPHNGPSWWANNLYLHGDVQKWEIDGGLFALMSGTFKAPHAVLVSDGRYRYYTNAARAYQDLAETTFRVSKLYRIDLDNRLVWTKQHHNDQWHIDFDTLCRSSTRDIMDGIDVAWSEIDPELRAVHAVARAELIKRGLIK